MARPRTYSEPLRRKTVHLSERHIRALEAGVESGRFSSFNEGVLYFFDRIIEICEGCGAVSDAETLDSEPSI